MSKKENKVSVNEMDKIIKANKKSSFTYTYSAGDENIEVIINPTISFRDRGALISDIADLVIQDNVYYSYLEDFAFAYEFLTYFTNVKTDIKADKLWEFCQLTTILDDIDNAIGMENAYSIRNEAKNMIEFKKQQILKSKSDELYDTLIMFVNKVANMIEKLPKSFDLGKLKDFDINSLNGILEKFTNANVQNIQNKEPDKQNIELKDLNKQ